MDKKIKYMLLSLVGGVLIALGLLSKNGAMAILAAISGVHLTIWAYHTMIKE